MNKFEPCLDLQPFEKDPALVAQQGSKLGKVVQRRYIYGPGNVLSYTHYFSVPKGTDIRMVYDASKSGLNSCIWVPRFPLPNIDTHLRSVEPGTWMGDLDVGEMCLNFPLHASLRALCGVDLTQYGKFIELETTATTTTWELRSYHWTRCPMGLRPSPYQTVRGMMVAEEVIRGDPSDPNNVFRWDHVEENLPATDGYDPTRAWIVRVRSDGTLASDLFTYVDDQRCTGATEQECWLAERRIGSTNTYLGIQDASRKRRGPSRKPGAWSGSVVQTTDGVVGVRVSQEKWDKAQVQVGELKLLLESDRGVANRARLESIRGFLLYLSRTYPSITPYIKGLHLTIDGWRPDRDAEGWRKPKAKQHSPRSAGLGEAVERNVQRLRVRDSEEEGWEEEELEAPTEVKLMPRMGPDVSALERFFSTQLPPLRVIRGRVVLEAFYGFGDASGTGFGASFDGDTSKQIFYRFGQWCTSVSEESSNYRELRNLVESLRDFLEEYDLTGVEIFLFTDNTVAESAYWKGNSASRKLFELILELKELERDRGLLLHVIHVSGKRMIAQGTDGLSRADFSEGIMAGKKMTNFCPLHLSCEARAPGIKDILLNVMMSEGHPALALEPGGWYGDGHQPGSFLWTPAPALADVVVEQLGKARHKRPDCMHVVAVPRLMTGRWRRNLMRECDFYFRVPTGCPFWPSGMYEPLLICVCLPFVPHRPWLHEKRSQLDSLVSALLEDGLWENGSERGWTILRKFLLESWTFSGV
jgi:hypothetical protein